MASALVVGGSGFLGRSLLKTLGDRALGSYERKPFPGGIHFDAVRSTLAEVEASLPADLRHVFILYAVANPDLCARDPLGTRATNVESTIRLCKQCFERNLIPVFLSTDYVYSSRPGERTEDEFRSPTTEYGRQKAEVEEWLESVAQPWLICRSSKIVGGELGTHSVFGQWIEDIKGGRTIRCALDQIFTPGDVRDVAAAIVKLADSGQRGLFHVAGQRSMSRYELASLLIAELRNRRPDVAVAFESCKLADIPFFETRPLDTSISTAKLRGAITHRFTSMEDLAREVVDQHFPAVGS
jgi:dTDP-4-dehydrorhamnose reductase